MTLILRKLLASSTYAISDTLNGLASRLQAVANAAEHVPAPAETVADNLEDFPEIEDEWAEDDEEEGEAPAAQQLSPGQLAELRQEMAMLREFHTLAKSIIKNSKGEVLLTALRRGFAASEQAQKSKGVPALQQKALIFTESRRTQDYLYQILEKTEFAGKVILFNGSNTDPKSKEIYQRWLERHAGTDVITNSPTADKRAALVEYFRDEASVMIATEAAAEGINLQFCNLVVNYDLPWNPQRIEQRIGRCHRYGQKFDVVVVNFLNRSNAADVRVYQLLDEKFRLFNGVFGASDEVLGAIESGVDFEKRIVAIYQKCRTPEQISFEFDQLQKDLEAEIGNKRKEAREQLLNNFDQEVVEKVRVSSGDYLDRFEEWLWQITRYYLGPYARFDHGGYSFVLERNPFEGERIHPGPYRLGKRVEDANTYRIGHLLAQRILTLCKDLKVETKSVRFDYRNSGKRIAVVEPLVGNQGWLLCSRVALTAFETEDYLLFAGFTDGGDELDHNQCRRLFDITGMEEATAPCDGEVRSRCDSMIATEVQRITARLAEKNGVWFDAEMDKLDRWAEDQRRSLKADLEELDGKIKEIKKEARSAPNLPTKLDLQRQLRQLETKRNEAWKQFDESSRELERKKDGLLDDISQRLNQKTEREDLFLVRWQLT
jgi:hypothetical protein